MASNLASCRPKGNGKREQEKRDQQMTSVTVMMSVTACLSYVAELFIHSCVFAGLRGSGPKKCCFRFNEKPVPKSRVVSYIRTSKQCSIPAVLLKTEAGRQLCVRPSAPWVKELISHLNATLVPWETSNL
ncbi:C-C motif chemokine 3-like [Thunnus albacares]|uniref:C-C motif chemokine 3-like n=1 Tax=Thunnus albacares TaxID=8236 RepID=UPI001CF6CD34|nr:C-C motif chemokine 3-like [Thunnus albacares]